MAVGGKGTLWRLILSYIYIFFISVLPLYVSGFVGSDAGVKKTQKTSTLNATPTPTPIDPSGWPDRFPAKEHCSKCGLCETSFVSRVSDACAFLDEGMARMDALEVKIHGRGRDIDKMVWSDNCSSKEESDLADEGRFGVCHQPMMLARGVGISNAQWTGCVTGIALSMLESGMVDAVICIATENSGEKEQWSSPEPIIAKTTEDVLRGRGVKPALAPGLRVLDEINRDTTIRKLLFCGVGCAVQGECSIWLPSCVH
jgi:coenzyme F420-reducing hydrogenase beta subunit